tara:strand:+ start:4560 stop:5282 length:723 start_codon:yes stop_codon:yes gene_type:complete
LKRLPKILIGAPTADVKQYCADEWFENVKALVYYDFDIFLADNSLSGNHIDFWRKKGVWIESANNNPKDSVIKRLTDSHNLVREKTLKGGYDYLLHLEVDVMPPPEVLVALLSHRKPLVSLSYDIYDAEDRESVSIRTDTDYDGEETAIIRGKYSELWFDGQCKQAWTNGVGCALIHRSVLEKIPFRYVADNNAFPDSWFAYDCSDKGIAHFIDTSMYCHHKNRDWRKYGDDFATKIFDK